MCCLFALEHSATSQELTTAGAHVRTIGSEVIHDSVMSIAATDDLIAVGVWSDETEKIMMFHVAGGDLARSFAVKGDAEGQLKGSDGMRFTPDGGHILIAEYVNSRLSLFTVAGDFVRCIGVGSLSMPRDVDFLTNGDLLVADSGKHRICILSYDRSSSLRGFGSYGDAAGKFKYPFALAMFGDQLFVLDKDTARVQVLT